MTPDHKRALALSRDAVEERDMIERARHARHGTWRGVDRGWDDSWRELPRYVVGQPAQGGMGWSTRRGGNRQRGQPRIVAADRAILRAALGLVAGEGYGGFAHP